jgi:hypothetical protein
MSERYNGWTNYETWLVNLWMDNEQGSQDFFREVARGIHSQTDAYNTGLTVAEEARFRFSDWLKQYYSEETRPELPGVYGDLLCGALSSVNWDEIARHYIDAIVEEESNGVQNGR